MAEEVNGSGFDPIAVNVDAKVQNAPSQEQPRKRGNIIEWVRGIFGKKNKSIKPHPTQKPERTQANEEKPPPENFDRSKSREVDSLAELGTPDLQILPGDHWATHYPYGAEARNSSVERLFEGSTDPSLEVRAVTPDVLLYDTNDIDIHGLEPVRDRIYDTVTAHTNYDYPKFTNFVAQMSGTQMTSSMAEGFYNTVAGDKIKNVMLDEYSTSDLRRIIQSIKNEITIAIDTSSRLEGMQKILGAAKVNAFHGRQLATITQLNAIEQTLTDSEQEVYQRIKDVYSQYVERGDESAYESVVREIKEFYSQEDDQEDQDEKKESGTQENDQSSPDASQEDKKEPPPEQQEKSRPPRATDEYAQPTESSESGPQFEITPPQMGYYVRERHTHYDRATKTWSHTKNYSPYTRTSNSATRKTISSIPIDQQDTNVLLELPIPPDHIVDMNSVEATGQKPEILQDETGTFYITKADAGEYKVDFVKEEPSINTIPPTSDESASLYSGSSLSAETESFLSSLSGSDSEKVVAIQKFIRQQHTYPDDPGAVQNGIRNGSTGDNYIQNLDSAPELECYSAASLFAALSRHENIPTRVIIGDHIKEATGGVAVIDSTTKHAWNEVWIGGEWVTIDATPFKASEQGKSGEQGEPGEQAGEQSDEPGDGQQSGGEQGELSEDGQQGEGEGEPQGENGMPGGDASDQDIQQGEDNLDASRQAIDEAQARQQEINERMNSISSFEDMEQLKEDLASDPALFEDIKEALEKRADALKDQMKQELQDEIDTMTDEGFLSEEESRELLEKMEGADAKTLDKISEKLYNQAGVYREFQELKEEVTPLVDYWYEKFVEILPKFDVIDIDDDSTTKRGSLDVGALVKPVNAIYGRGFHPRVIRPEVRPLILKSVVMDVSLSMVMNDNAGNSPYVPAGFYNPRTGAIDTSSPLYDPTKLNNAKKLAVLNLELASRLEKEYGYLRFSMYSFSDGFDVIKRFDQEYGSTERYHYPDGENDTVKARLMKKMRVNPGTNILQTLQKAGRDLTEETHEYPDYLSILDFIGDGGDTHENEERVRSFIAASETSGGFGDHSLNAIMLGNESQRKILANIFGEKRTAVAPDFDTLMQEQMEKYAEDIEVYFS